MSLIERVEALAAQWERDAADHLERFGQHLPCSVESMAEQLRAALNEPAPRIELEVGIEERGQHGLRCLLDPCDDCQREIECPHDWTLRPESDTYVCEMCGAER